MLSFILLKIILRNMYYKYILIYLGRRHFEVFLTSKILLLCNKLDQNLAF